MEKQKRWQLAVILAVCALTLYNILPTIIYYSKPLNEPITQERAQDVMQSITTRVDSLEEQSKEWIGSFCSLLHIKPMSISIDEKEPSLIKVQFHDAKQAKVFKQYLPRAGALIPFVPAQLGLLQGGDSDTTVSVVRRIGVHFNEQDDRELFRFTTLKDKETIAPFYFDLIADRFAETIVACEEAGNQFGGLQSVDSSSSESLDFANRMLQIRQTFGENSTIFERYLSAIQQGSFSLQDAVKMLESEKKKLDSRLAELKSEKKAGTQPSDEVTEYVDTNLRSINSALQLLQSKIATVQKQTKPLSRQDVIKWLGTEGKKNKSVNAVYTLNLQGRHPLIQQLTLDWARDAIVFGLYPDIQAILDKSVTSEQEKLQQEEVNRWLMNDLATITQITQEEISQEPSEYKIKLNRLSGCTSLIAMQLKEIGGKVAQMTREQVSSLWKPTHQDLKADKLPIYDEVQYAGVPFEQKKLCLLVLSPAGQEQNFPELREGSVYVILRGVQSIIDQYRKFPNAEEAQLFSNEFQNLANLLQRQGFIGYSGASFGQNSSVARDFIFELSDYYSALLKATRENFYVTGSKKYAVLEFTNVEQRIITENRIDNAIQEDLLRWKEAYQAALVDLSPQGRFTVPQPTQNVYWANFKRSSKAYFRGDDSRVLRWGLDLSGGKSVRIALADHSNRPVKNPEDLKQAVNELYARINNMGVSERTIRIENDTILIDFPGSQAFDAQELVKASAMFFHVANEQFGPFNKALAKEVNEFLQDVWNEAVITNRKDIESINQIAYDKLQIAANRPATFGPQDSAQVLFAKGLRLADLKDSVMTSAFDDSVSMIARLQGDDPAEWHYASHPLMIVFHNYALDGSSLENIQTGYDPSKGNILMFGVRSSYAKERTESGNPRDAFYAWTSQFCEEKIMGTPRETYSQGRGWRMAVILNGAVISNPSLNAALRDHAMISGNFSQREVMRLATDLKAGSLSFTPKILSEENVSPELGNKERKDGIVASVVGVLGVVALMIGYYRFAGAVACVAVFFNILIIWAVMQNIDYALTLPSIAGIVLTVGMAVDANVLVFERIREEFKESGRIASAIHIGYRKAFSAIVDSNLTTILAALILMQFDCGPIRGFAITLIIGIVASMFTALFMTRYFFAGWVQNPENKELKMAEWIKPTQFDFLKYTKPAFTISAVLLVAGALLFATEWRSIFGMDFTGGYSLVVDVVPKDAKVSPRDAAIHALEAKGLSSQDFQIRELGRPTHLRIQLSRVLEESGKVFSSLTQTQPDVKTVYEYQKNPRIQWVVSALDEGGVPVKESDLGTLDRNWTSMSGQLSDAMRNNAIMALGLAVIGVLIYIAIRFEWKYAVASVLALMHDVVLTLAVIALAHKIGMPVQIDLQVIGAIMTIIGYSLNDTIIVFDRIREDLRLMRKKSFAEIINIALNSTLSRTLMTSGTTLVVLVSLVCLGGSSIFAFSFVMMVGVFLGTLSSLFIASPILLWLENREKEKLHSHSVT